MTIDQAAEAAGVKPSSWANWEAGRRPQRETDVIGAIADALDIDFNWLLFGGQLLSARGRPTNRPNPVTGWYPNLTDQSRVDSARSSNHRPKGRTDPRGPSNTPRRAALVR